MKLSRAIIIGTIIWIIGVSLYSLSFYIPILDDAEQQANILLSVVVIPLVWFGTKLYYKKEDKTHGYWIGLTFFLTAAVLDATITIPLLIIPNGGSYFDFFANISFWIIALEFIAITVLYWYHKVYVKELFLQSKHESLKLRAN